jgi:phosphatidylserine decarboxylase
MVRLLLLVLLLYVGFAVARWFFRVFLFPFLRPPTPPPSPPDSGAQQRPSIDPAKIRDADFVDLPPDTNGKSE